MSHWFFLSYARDKRDEYLNKYLPIFHKELNSMIHNLAPGEGEDGFLDMEGIELGKQWPDALMEALQNCRTFVSLYSPAYFDKEYCGKEWQVFSFRQAAYSASLPAHANPPSLLMPVLWSAEEWLPSPLPAVAAAVQYNHSAFGDLYAKEGLQHFMMLRSRYHNRYRDFLKNFAKKLIQEARAHPLPRLPQLPPIDEIESAFQRRGPEVIKPAEECINGGPRSVQFIFVAGRRDELRDVREKLDPYGDEGGCDWHPYLPDVPFEVGITAQRVATEGVLRYGRLKLDDKIIKQLRAAERQNKIVAIVVDTWTLHLPVYRTPMLKYDRRNFLNCVVLVAWNNRDDELTEKKRSELQDVMQETFKRNFFKHDRNCFLEINSHDELINELSAVLKRVRARIREHGAVMKKAESEQRFNKPSINGVRGASA